MTMYASGPENLVLGTQFLALNPSSKPRAVYILHDLPGSGQLGSLCWEVQCGFWILHLGYSTCSNGACQVHEIFVGDVGFRQL